MTKKLAAAAVLLGLAVIIILITRGGENMQYYNHNRNRVITASQAREMMRSNPNAVILDVRTKQEFSKERIPGAISLPDYAINDRATTLIPSLNTMILIYCRSGVRSRSAMYDLLALGYTNAYDFGGIMNWPYEKE